MPIARMGYLPVALRNYLVRLGWSQGDKEFFSTEEMIAAFRSAEVGRSAARFDFVKLENMNGHYMRACRRRTAADARRVPALPAERRRLAARLDDEMPAACSRHAGPERACENLVDLVDGARFLFAERPLVMEAKAQEILDHGGRTHLAALLPALAALSNGPRHRPRRRCASMPRLSGAKLGQVAQPLAGADWECGFARYLRCPRGARSGGKPRTAARSGSRFMSCRDVARNIRASLPCPLLRDMAHGSGLRRTIA